MPDLTPEQAIEKLKALPEDKQREVLGKLSPDQRKDILALLKGGTLSKSAPFEKPGVISRTLQGLGLPQSREELAKMKPSTAEMIGGPAITAGKMALNYGKALYRQGQESGKEIFEAGENIGKGGPVGLNLGKAASAVVDFNLKGAGAPLGTGALSAWGEDIQNKNWSGAVGDAIAVMVNALMLKGARPKDAAGKTNAISFVTDASRGVEDLKTILPDIEKAAGKEPPKTVGAILDSVNQAKKNMNTESGLAMYKIKNQNYVPIDIANRIKGRITPDMAKVEPGLVTKFQEAALDFQKPWTFEELDALRMRWGSELSGYFKMNPAERTAFLKAHPDATIKLEVVQGIQDIVYPAMDKAAGKPQGYFAGLKQRQSALIDLQKELEGRADELATQTAKIKGGPRFGQGNVSVYGATTSSSAHPGVSLHRLHNVVKRPNPLGAANAAVSKAFTGGRYSKAGIYSLPVRELLLEPKQKKPGEQIKDLHAIQQQHSSNPNTVGGEEN